MDQVVHKARHPTTMGFEVRFSREARLTGMHLFTPFKGACYGFSAGLELFNVEFAQDSRPNLGNVLNLYHFRAHPIFGKLSFYYSLYILKKFLIRAIYNDFHQ
jgi:hypothetical protein